MPVALQQLAVRALEYAGGYFRARLGRELPSISVYIYSDINEIVAAYAAALGVSDEVARRLWPSTDVQANAPPNKIFVYVQPGYSAAANLTKIIVHEAFHTVQAAILGGGVNAHAREAPAWLIEGSAEYIAYQTIATYGLDSVDNIRRSRIDRVKATATPLSSLHTYAGFVPQNSPYPLSALAGERLAGIGGEPLLANYFDAVAAGASWQDAFRNVFGRTVETFYTEFEVFRSGL